MEISSYGMIRCAIIPFFTQTYCSLPTMKSDQSYPSAIYTKTGSGHTVWEQKDTSSL